MDKLCKTCNQLKSYSMFYKNSSTKDGYRGSCKPCIDLKNAEWRIKNPEKMKGIYDKSNSRPERKSLYKAYRKRNRARMIISGARARAAKEGYPFNISETDLFLPENCPVFSTPLDYEATKANDNSPSLDKIIPSLGYVSGNVQIISNLANRMKSNASKEQLEQFANWILSGQFDLMPISLDYLNKKYK